ncbi:hypothetical protein [uncultured Rhodospira sp.]|uniref:hypothetical protein n=1 Tax=uncultured Rhodospira sp. TaxID=1936189 RepID=UPI002633906C|nr:hypothetical protein [uncultured Rhodospira sp.]
MITIWDCYGLSDAVPDEVVVVASHERLPPVLAAGKAYDTLAQPWGAPAIRQMILDEYCRAGAHGDRAYADDLAALYAEARRLHPGGRDRRRLRRPTLK